MIILAFIITSATWGFYTTRVPYIRSNRHDTLHLLSKVPMQPGSVFYDLGSGDGRVVFLAEKVYGVKSVGFETTVWAYLHAVLKKYKTGSLAVFRRENFFEHSWSEANLVYCFLYPPLMGRVERKFLQDCRPGTILVSRDFALPNLEPVEVVDFTYPHNAYIYRR